MSDNHMPKEPLPPMTEMFTQMHELFVSMLASGFTSWQACRILGVFLAENGRQA